MIDLFGYFGAVIAIFFFGTNYVPAKQYPTYDGIIFQWFMCSGIICVGLAWGLVSNHWGEVAKAGMYIFPEGLIGGSLWAIANLLIPTVVNTIGLGIGFMLWNGFNIIVGHLVARLGLFGVRVTVVSNIYLSEFGIICILLSIVIFGLVEPKVSKIRIKKRDSMKNIMENTPLLTIDPMKIDTINHNNIKHSLTDLILDVEKPNYGPFELAGDIREVTQIDSKREEKRIKTFGILLSIIVGCILGNCLTPYVIWKQNCQPSLLNAPIYVDCNPLNFVFSQCVGVYITSTIIFLFYSTFHKFIKREMPRSVLRPAYVSGVLWGMGLAGQLLASGHLGYSLAYPLTSIGPSIVSMMWSTFYFKEIEGIKNYKLLIYGTSMAMIGIILLTLGN